MQTLFAYSACPVCVRLAASRPLHGACLLIEDQFDPPGFLGFVIACCANTQSIDIGKQNLSPGNANIRLMAPSSRVIV
jgi:hypothetical protein